MAKYIGSPWGRIIGKLGPAVGFVWRGGITIVRAYRKTTPKGATKKALLQKSTQEISARRVNISRIVMGPLGYLAGQNLHNLIHPIWEDLCKRKHYYALEGVALFVKQNFSNFYHSIPKPDKFYSPHNMPDITKLLLSAGDLEPTPITYTSILPVGRQVTQLHNNSITRLQVSWNPKCYYNGKPDDNAYLIAIHWKLQPSKNGVPDLNPWETIKLFGTALIPVAKRSDATASLSAIALAQADTTQLAAYLFFGNKKIGFSPSSCMNL